MRQLGHPAGDLLAQRQRRGVLQVGAADLDDVGKRLALGLQRGAQLGMAGSSFCSMAVTAATCMAVG
jgi:hypothetical protein